MVQGSWTSDIFCCGQHIETMEGHQSFEFYRQRVGIGILSLLHLSNLTLHGNKRMPGKQMAQWHAINAGKYTNLLHILYISFN